MNRNYNKELLKLMEEIRKSKSKKSLLLHSCCAPCSSYTLEFLSECFDITVLYYNPNIYPPEEYYKRVKEQEKFINEALFTKSVKFIASEYNPEEFYAAVKGFENIREGGERCFRCYRLRLEEAAKAASKRNIEYFTTTLSISPYKNAEKINEIGEELALKYKVKHLPSDFKKGNGFKRSTELSKEYNMYRQDYCGCVFSKKEREELKKAED